MRSWPNDLITKLTMMPVDISGLVAFAMNLTDRQADSPSEFVDVQFMYHDLTKYKSHLLITISKSRHLTKRGI